ncbi:MAG: hypothetical protein LBU43_05810 [Candidatus Accumulibacter sp.]|nr:hypothetical protein [Accumulibacter sp.]
MCLVSFFVPGCSPTKDQEQANALIPSVSKNQDMKVVAYFEANTGGGIWLDGHAGPYKLELHLEFNDPDSNEKIVIKEVIAKCGQISSGTVFGDKTEQLIDFTLCEEGIYDGIEHYAGMYWLISEFGELTVREGWFNHPQKIIATYRMPSPGIRATTKEK